MKNPGFYILVLFFGFSVNLFGQSVDYKPFPEWSWGIEDSSEFMLYTPKNMEPGEVYPLALFMHGCCGENNHASARNAVDPPARMWHNFGANTQRIPTYIISVATSRGWSQHFESLKKVIDNLIENGQVDPQRIYVTGFSMGGRGTWQIIQEYPDYFAAALPMGMDFIGDSSIVKDIPIWTNQGETDWYSRGLRDNVAKIRTLNNYPYGGVTWETGINPRYSNFKGIGHGVQWDAASRQDLVGWAYSKINDGNIYPNVFFESPEYKDVHPAGKEVILKVSAEDPDGSIEKVEIYIYDQLYKTINKKPYETSFIPEKGDTKLKAVAYDDRGKTSVSQIILRVDNSPVLSTVELPYGRVGALYQKQLQTEGNGPFIYSVDFEKNMLPAGISLSEDGLIKGIPLEEGKFPVSLIVTDEDGDLVRTEFELEVRRKRDGEIVVYNARNKFNVNSPVSKMRLWETPNFNVDNQINFSNLNGFDELTLIQTDIRDLDVKDEEYLSFVVSEDVTVFVGYEKFDNLFTSTIPEWLKDWEKVKDKEIVAQYRYFDVYKKEFPKGKITLPGGDVNENKVKLNYFVMIKGQNDLDYSPEISTGKLPVAKLHKPFWEQLDHIYGKGEIKWEIVSGELPKGIELCKCGILSGSPEKNGKFKFTVTAADSKGKSTTAELEIRVD